MADAEAKLKPSRSGRYYIRGETAPFEEDMVHEFKGHRNLCVEELPPWTRASETERASRQAISRYMNDTGTCKLVSWYLLHVFFFIISCIF